MTNFFKKIINQLHEKIHAKKDKTKLCRENLAGKTVTKERVFVLGPFLELDELRMRHEFIEQLCKNPKQFTLNQEPFGIYLNAQALPSGTDFATIAPKFKKRYVAEFNISIAELNNLLADENLLSYWSGLNVPNPKKISKASSYLHKHLDAIHCDVFNPRTESWNRAFTFSIGYLVDKEWKHLKFHPGVMGFR